MFPIEPIAGLLGTVLPIAIKAVGRIFGKKENQSPTDALDDIAMTKPEVLPQYIEGLGKLYEARTKWFQRDVTEGVKPWIASFRAAIRPSVVLYAFVLLTCDMVYFFFAKQHALDEGTRASFAGYVGTWVGDRIDF